jgi:aspartyl/glutamyl-tRNA(Asn/Gln) amidotransferase C subunit
MISKEEVQHIAKLARLELTEKEIEKMQKDLTEILDYFNLLKKVPKLAQGEPGSRPQSGLGTRKDEVVSSHDIVDELIAAAPDKRDDYIKVKAIL